MIPKATKSYAMEDPAPGEGPAAGGEALRIFAAPFTGSRRDEIGMKSAESSSKMGHASAADPSPKTSQN